MANVINKLQKPTLIIAHNKTLAAQLYAELKELFPHNRVDTLVKRSEEAPTAMRENERSGAEFRPDGCPPGWARNLNFSNRPVRTRMPGGVAGVPGVIIRGPYADRQSVSRMIDLMEPFEDLKSSEVELRGAWISDGSRVHADGVCGRIDWLLRNRLERIGSDALGGPSFRDPGDGRYWEFRYPKSEMHGGGPPALTAIHTDEVRARYGVRTG